MHNTGSSDSPIPEIPVFLINDLPVAYQSLDAAGCFIEVNDHWCNELGYERAEIIGHWFGEILPENGKQAFREKFPFIKQAKQLHSEFTVRHKNGHYLIYSFDVQVGLQSNGKFRQTHCLLQNITDKRLSEKRLLESESRFRQMFESSVVAKSITTLDGFMQPNARFCELLGYTVDEIGLLNWRDLTHPDDVSLNEDLISRILKGEKDSDRWEKRYIHKNGSVIWVDITTILIKDESNTALYFLSEMVDITGKKKALFELQDRELFFRESQRVAQIGSYRLDMINEHWTSSEVLDHIFGIDATYDRSIRGWGDLIFDDDALIMNRYFDEEVLKKHLPFDKEYRIKRSSDGAVRWVHGMGQLTFDATGNVLTMFGTIQDITVIKEAQAALLRSEERNRTILETTIDGYWRVDRTGKILEVNQSMCEMLGYSKEELINMRVSDVEDVEKQEDVEKHIQFAIAHSGDRFETCHRRKDGRIIEMDVSLQFLDMSGGEVVAFFRDITDRKRVDNALRESEEKFKRTFMSSPDGVTITRLSDGLFVLLNRAYTQIFGYEETETIGQKSTDLNLWVDAEERTRWIEIINQFGEVKNYDAKFRTKSGEVLDCLVSASMIELNAEKHIISQTRDITDRKKAERQLIESEERFRGVLSTVNLISLLLDLSGNIQFCNDFLLELTGWNRDEIQGKNWFDNFIPEEQREMVRNMFISSVSGGDIPPHFENNIITRKGKVCVVEWNNIMFYDEKGTVTGLATIGVDVTAQRKAQKALKQSRERLDRAELASNSGNWELHIDREIMAVSKGAMIIYGLKNEESEYGQIKEMPLPEYRSYMDDAMKELIENEQPYDIEFKIKTANAGEIKDIHSTAIYDKENKVVSGVIQDITERKKIQQALAESEVRFRELFDKAPDAIILADIQTGKIADVNEATCRMLMMSKEDIVGRYHYELQPSEHRRFALEAFQQHLNQSQMGEKTSPVELFLSRSDGKCIPVEIVAQQIVIENKPYLMGTFRDITERKEAEKEIKESREKLMALFNGMSEMAVIHEMIFDENGNAVDYRLIDCNDAFTEISGLSQREVIGKKATEVYQTENPPYLEEYAEVCRSGQNYEFSTWYQPMEKHFLISAVPLGENRFATITADITDIQQAKEQILDKNREMENYMYVASHDLRAPLVNIQGFSQRLEKQTSELMQFIQNSSGMAGEFADALYINIRKSLDFILNNVAKMDGLINGLLQLSRTGQLHLNPVMLDMNRFMNQVVSSFNFQLAECGASVEMNPLDACYGDETQLNQLFSNLLNNAIKYRNTDRQPQIVISCTTHHNKVIYSVKDNGVGIDEKYQNRIWDLFYRVNPNNSVKGDGLGLSLAKQIVGKHNGRIWLESIPGEGTIFFVELPAKATRGNI